TAADGVTGRFNLTVHDAAGHAVRLRKGLTVVLRESGKTVTITLPAVSLHGGKAVTVAGGAHETVQLSANAPSGKQNLWHGNTGATGDLKFSISPSSLGRSDDSLQVRVSLAPGISLEKVMALSSCTKHRNSRGNAGKLPRAGRC
ncbi:MAG: hypothetical protein LC772_10275, partial [Chloroflexi bacterium]|nr:hypothetical protein [Chloroflexota bacterium]